VFEGAVEGNDIVVRVYDVSANMEYETTLAVESGGQFGDLFTTVCGLGLTGNDGCDDGGGDDAFYDVQIDNTGYGHLVVFLDGIDGLEAGDEIGVFDADVCVGRGIIDATIAPSNMLPIVASAQDASWPINIGFASGHNISYRFWDASELTEVVDVSATHAEGFSDTFSNQGSTYVGLDSDGLSVIVEEILGCTDDTAVKS
jgi:hypothetical protein